MKRNIKIMASVTLILILASCSSQYSGNLWIEYKNNILLNRGYAATVYEDRIYYVSNELGTAGIYSMKYDGTDIRIETANPDIKCLEISNGVMYYNGLYRINKKQGSIQSSVKNDHTIYTFSFGGKAEPTDYTDKNHNVQKFYISQNGYIGICYGSLAMEEFRIYDIDYSESFSNEKDKITKVSFQYTDRNTYNEIANNKNNKTENVISIIYQFGDFLIIAGNIPEGNEINWFTYSEDPYVLDSNTGELVLSYDLMQSEALKAFCMDKRYIYCSYKEMAVIIDRTTYQVETAFIPEALSNEYNIAYMTLYGGKLYIIADYWKDHDKKTPPLMGEKLLIMDTDNFTSREVLNLSEGQKVIRMDEKSVTVFDKGIIYETDISDDKIGEKTKVVELGSDFNSGYYTIDYAGEWIFIYKVTYPEQKEDNSLTGQQLRYKINLETGQVIENTIKFDFSAFDRYKEN